MSRADAFTLFGLNTAQLAEFAKRAVGEAVAQNVKAGNQITGLVEGRVQTLGSTAPRIAKSLQQDRRHARAE
ncbi:hypothetical protein BDD18_4118 [Acidovorax temperans]|uniref:Uncharacterized protein n=1 Tax=Acidovorax temperans TaxID=80878 RepID=A0A543KWK3_9BURK|nr:hypothetical protein BDD18_4118 [Acidovorax temperans]